MERVVEHGHCEMCGKVVTLGTRVCGDACQERLDQATREKKRYMWLFLGVIIATFLLARLTGGF